MAHAAQEYIRHGGLPRSDMRVYLYFRRDKDRTPYSARYLVYGRYSQTGFIFEGSDGVRAFGTWLGGTFSEYERGVDDLMPEWPGRLDALEIMPRLTQEVSETLLKTCEACAQANIPFNLVDLLLIHMPFDKEDTRLFQVRSLNNCQAVILILRECVSPHHNLHQVVKQMHSRQTLVETLYDKVRAAGGRPVHFPRKIPVTGLEPETSSVN